MQRLTKTLCGWPAILARGPARAALDIADPAAHADLPVRITNPSSIQAP
jgi:hypothetical protein